MTNLHLLCTCFTPALHARSPPYTSCTPDIESIGTGCSRRRQTAAASARPSPPPPPEYTPPPPSPRLTHARRVGRRFSAGSALRRRAWISSAPTSVTGPNDWARRPACMLSPRLCVCACRRGGRAAGVLAVGSRECWLVQEKGPKPELFGISDRAFGWESACILAGGQSFGWESAIWLGVSRVGLGLREIHPRCSGILSAPSLWLHAYSAAESSLFTMLAASLPGWQLLYQVGSFFTRLAASLPGWQLLYQVGSFAARISAANLVKELDSAARMSAARSFTRLAACSARWSLHRFEPTGRQPGRLVHYFTSSFITLHTVSAAAGDRGRQQSEIGRDPKAASIPTDRRRPSRTPRPLESEL
jgi:hypothetical protein